MNQYCYSITSKGVIDSDDIKNHINKLYMKKKFGDLAFDKDEKIPFIVIYSEKDKQVCIKMTSRAKKNIERIEGIHEKITARDLKIGDNINLSKPFLFTLKQSDWYKQDKIAEGDKWSTLSHNGPYFVHIYEPYEPHGIKIIYDGKKYALNPTEERVATFYAQRLYSEAQGNIKDLWTKDKLFNENYWKDFKTYLTPEHKKIFKTFSKFDFTPIVNYIETKKAAEKNLTQKQKDAKKIKAAEKKQNYGYATINGTIEPLGNFTIEPAAIFYGRGDNKRRGMIKRDIEPEEVTINIGEEAEVPKPPKGHKWGNVINDKSLAWIASWKDTLKGENKYVYFAAEGQLKGKSDLKKYEKARKLNYYLADIRKRYEKDLNARSNATKQLATVLYLIDHYGIRVGGDKDDLEATTFGASTLLVKHVKPKPPNTFIFDFEGKDSIRFYKELKVSDQVFKNLSAFIKGKKPDDQLFDLIDASSINDYLKTFDKDFSAKVFRTRLGSTIMDDALKNLKVKKDTSQAEKKKQFIKANAKVADVLNHQRSISQKGLDTIKKYEDELKDLRKELREAKKAKKPERTLKSLENKIQKKKDQIESKKDTQNVAVSTSLTNYIDPRLVVSWAQKNEMNIPGAYTAALQRKFKWAIDLTEDDWDFNTTPLLPEMRNLDPSDGKVVKKPSVGVKGKGKGKGKKKIVKKVVKKKSVFDPNDFEDIPTPVTKTTNDIRIVDYSERSIAVIGDTKPKKELLMELGGKYNPSLKIGGEKVAGWIFSKKKGSQVIQALFGGKPEQKITLEEIYKSYDLTPKERMAITGISNIRNPAVILEKIDLSQSDIDEYLRCVRDAGSKLDLQDNMEPLNMVMFMIYLLHNTDKRYHLIDQILQNLDLQDICPGYEGYSLISAEPLKSLPENRLYVTRNGGCVDVEDLIMHLKASPNKILDPTDSTAKLWGNNQELTALLAALANYRDIQDLNKMFDNVRVAIDTGVSEETKAKINQLYKDLEKGEDADMMCFELADYMSGISDDEKKAIETATAFVGMDSEMWQNIYSGEDCKKSLLHTMKKVSDLLEGKYL